VSEGFKSQDHEVLALVREACLLAMLIMCIRKIEEPSTRRSGARQWPKENVREDTWSTRLALALFPSERYAARGRVSGRGVSREFSDRGHSAMIRIAARKGLTTECGRYAKRIVTLRFCLCVALCVRRYFFRFFKEICSCAKIPQQAVCLLRLGPHQVLYSIPNFCE